MSGADPRIKGTDVVTLRKLFVGRSPADQPRFLAQLDREDREAFETALAIHWLPADRVTRIFSAAAPFFFPNDESALRSLGKLMAERSFSGVYKLVLSVPSLPFVVSRAATVWSWYHDLGRATMEDRHERGVTLVVRGSPKLLWEIRELIAGHLLALADATRTKHARVEVESDDPDAWRWRISWEEGA